MVRRGQFLERPVIIPGEPPLEGLYHRGSKRPALLIAPPHPRDGGSMEVPVVAELAYAATRAGHPSLRFNYGGVGASPGYFDDRPEVGQRALQQALDHLAASVPAPAELAAVGVGYGAELVARRALQGDLGPILLVSPDPERLPDLSRLLIPWVIVVGQRDPRVDKGRLQRQVDASAQGRLAVIPEADQSFLRGLLDLGRILVEALDPPGMLELDPGPAG